MPRTFSQRAGGYEVARRRFLSFRSAIFANIGDFSISLADHPLHPASTTTGRAQKTRRFAGPDGASDRIADVADIADYEQALVG